ncbi:MAG: Os1348 family NHLP clan protein [Gaiellaceae bacterium]
MSEQGAQMIADRWVEDPAFRKELRDDTQGAVKRIGADLDDDQLEYLRSVDWSQSDEQLEELINKRTTFC